MIDAIIIVLGMIAYILAKSEGMTNASRFVFVLLIAYVLITAAEIIARMIGGAIP